MIHVIPNQIETLDKHVNSFVDYMFGLRDPRVRGWLMLDSYLPTFLLTLFYLFTIWLGTKYMKEKPAISLRAHLIVYNLGVMLLSLYMFVELIITLLFVGSCCAQIGCRVSYIKTVTTLQKVLHWLQSTLGCPDVVKDTIFHLYPTIATPTFPSLILASWEGGYNLQCQNLHSAGEADIRVAKVLWWYYFSKAIEFMDTIFFVLRKKNSQITFLHVYHHATMFNIWWCVLNWIPCGQSFFGPTLNSFIHVLMYSYYGLSTIPSMQPYLWWKKYLTQAQLIQFVLTIIHTLSAAIKPCGFPLGCLTFQSSYMATLVILFINFYRKTYRKTAQLDDKATANVREIKNGYYNGYAKTINGSVLKKKD